MRIVTFVSIGLRLRVEVEALNMVEALGAYTRHRTVSVFKRLSRDGKAIYRILIVPAISGQSIANGYHRAIVDLSKLMKIPVCPECQNYEKRGGFDKRSTANITHDDRVQECAVEDLTGFLAPEAGTRRTSPVSFSYMVPDVESARAALDPQFHVKYNFEEKRHQPFNIESGSAIYMLSINVDVSRIGRLESLKSGIYVKDRSKRVELAFKALSVLIEGLNFGAKKSRYLPINEVIGGIAAISNPLPFVVSAPRVYRDGHNYIEETIIRAENYLKVLSDEDYGEIIELIVMDKENLTKPNAKTVTITTVETFSEMISHIIKKVTATAS